MSEWSLNELCVFGRNDTQALKSLGFVYSAQGKLDQASEIYTQAISSSADSWRSMINLAEIHLIQDNLESAIVDFTRAYSVMQRNYSDEPQHIGP